MTRRKIIKISLSILAAIILVGGFIGYKIYNQPHRNVQATKTDFAFSASAIVNEYLLDAEKANEKYLDEEGNSKVLEVEGEVSSITEDFSKQKVVLLKSKSDSAGVSCTFTQETNADVSQIKVGDNVVVKGVIRSGASYDIDLGMYENVIMEKCKILNTR